MPRPISADGSTLVATAKKATYTAYGEVTGPSGGGPSGSDKAMMTLLNPTGSGKTIKVQKFRYQAISSSGTNLMIQHELRAITAHTAGTTVTPVKRDQADDASIAQVRTEPSSVTGGAVADRREVFMMQANTQQSPNSHEWRFGDLPEENHWILAEGEGLVVHQVTSNGGDFAITLVWTEETP